MAEHMPRPVPIRLSAGIPRFKRGLASLAVRERLCVLPQGCADDWGTWGVKRGPVTMHGRRTVLVRGLFEGQLRADEA